MRYFYLVTALVTLFSCGVDEVIIDESSKDNISAIDSLYCQDFSAGGYPYTEYYGSGLGGYYPTFASALGE